MKNILAFFVASLTIFFTGCSSKETVKETPSSIYERSELFKDDFAKRNIGFPVPPGSKIDTIKIDPDKKTFEIIFSQEFSYLPFRKENVKEIYSVLKNYFAGFNGYNFKAITLDYPIEELIPNFYREKNEINYDRIPKKNRQLETAVVRNVDNKSIPLNGLQNRNILLWHSHGWYYSINGKRWEWQRPRLFQSVEDMVPMQFVLPYLIPMFENAGARVFVPRERDTQTNEVIIDNDTQSDIKEKKYIERSGGKNNLWKTGIGNGFAYGNPPYPVNFNPFKQGTHRIITSETDGTASAEWTADIPETGNYAVYISYFSSEQNARDAQYIIHHAGGATEFKVNQTVGGNTWIYLGNFKFIKGVEAKVILTNKSRENGKIISADAVRFGGGMGIVERDGSASGRPKYLEGARYWLQYAGMPDTLVYDLNKTKNDYNDDYQSRAEYGNYLMGAPFGPNKKRDEKGLGIPIDLSIAFHTDAGITRNDTTIGTLSIYSLEGADDKSVFPDQVSRIANRDFADVVQTQVVNDIRAKYDTVWNRRQLRDAQYSESARPNFPAVLLELLSHQNFLDMQYVLDPRFRFDVARAIYKASLKFLSVQNNFEYAVQPLPVTHFSAELKEDGNIFLSWAPQNDPLEPTAKPDRYIVYTRVEDGGFDNGTLVYSNQFNFDKAEDGKIYSFKVTAVNNGGESFPGEILSACSIKGSKNTALIINGFDRISAPAKINTEKFAGFLNTIDAGVPDKYDIGFSGIQYNFDPEADYISNDSPGWGASNADFETKIVAGNTFDFPFTHGQPLREAGISFSSASDESIEENKIDIKNYDFVDLILGEEKTTHWQKPFADSVNGIQFQTFTKKMQNKISEYLLGGGNIFISGAYAASDIYNNGDSTDIQFLNETLKYKFGSDHASNLGEIFSVNNFFSDSLGFNTMMNDSIYAVEAPDAVNPVKDSEVLFRYVDNSFSAAVGYKKDYGVVVFGFPFETVNGKEARFKLMKQILKYFSLVN